ncbi:hypothetical protein F4804DRAFT_330422 [Jackrogersella minutella]|nr:hypothetical protein F4804DRAFT_330422 [Jackrogersella minutella]
MDNLLWSRKSLPSGDYGKARILGDALSLAASVCSAAGVAARRLRKRTRRDDQASAGGEHRGGISEEDEPCKDGLASQGKFLTQQRGPRSGRENENWLQLRPANLVVSKRSAVFAAAESSTS